MGEFAFVYGAPWPGLRWPTFLSLVKQTSRFDARVRLQLFDSVRSAIGSALGGDTSGRARDELLEQAYPLKSLTPRWIENLARTEEPTEPEGGADV